MKRRKAPQDETRENFTRTAMGLLETGEGRGGADAKDEHGNFFELKSAPNENNNTASVRSLGIDHIHKFRTRHWIFAYGETFDDNTFELNEFHYVSPQGMEQWISKIEASLLTRRELSARVLGTMRKSLTPSEMETLETIHRWGCKLNVPMISYTYVTNHGILLLEPYPEHLKKIMKDVRPMTAVTVKKPKGLEKFFP